MKGNREKERSGRGGTWSLSLPPFLSPTQQGPAMPSKQWAEKAAALQAIRILHEAKELDDSLVPIARRAGELDDSLVPIARRAGEDSDDVVDEGGRGERMNKDAGTQKKSQIYKKEVSPISEVLDNAPPPPPPTCPAH